jgi:hypothetical protein
MSKHLCEATLVMIEALFTLIVNCADINNDIASVKNCRVSTTYQVCVPSVDVKKSLGK